MLKRCVTQGWTYSKIISRFDSLVCSLSTERNITDLLQREHTEIFAEIGVRCGKMWLSVYKITVIYLIRCNRTKVTFENQSHTRFRLMPKSTTLDDLEGPL